jgi:hypothetical protein
LKIRKDKEGKEQGELQIWLRRGRIRWTLGKKLAW